MSTSKFFAGALIGLVAGLLIAPEKGEEMREDIAVNAEKWRKKLNRMLGKTGAELDDLKRLLGEEVEGLSDDVRHRILNILDESRSTASNIKSNFTTEFRYNRNNKISGKKCKQKSHPGIGWLFHALQSATILETVTKYATLAINSPGIAARAIIII
jgi:gas vesicle protein